MHVISRKKLREFCQKHADCCEILDDWYRIASKANWVHLAEVQTIYPQAEAVDNFTVFNIKGNNYRLITSINYLSRDNLTPEEDALLELLVKLIENFEDKHYQLQASTPVSRLLHLMDARSLEPDDLVGVLGAKEIVAQIYNGQLEINPEQAESLGKFFFVDSSLFL